ncbi:hypothetical protein EYV94_03200 [Puteibacter caeruleilacunae]|nr:hypothetical protein EYV94_03200 [Puteibacter caeruleilacunae]
MYIFCDATSHAEFLYDCVIDTIINIIPSEVIILSNYDEFEMLELPLNPTRIKYFRLNIMIHKEFMLNIYLFLHYRKA